MTPEEVFAGSDPEDWGSQLCLFLIREHPQIRRRDDYDTLSQAISGWQEMPHRDSEDRARSLFSICEQHGLISQLLPRNRPVRPRGTTGTAVRTRGKPKTTGVPAGEDLAHPQLDELLAGVATAYAS